MGTQLGDDGKEYHNGVLVESYCGSVKQFELEPKDAIGMNYDGLVTFLITARVGPDQYAPSRNGLKRKNAFTVEDCKILTPEESAFMKGQIVHLPQDTSPKQEISTRSVEDFIEEVPAVEIKDDEVRLFKVQL